MSQEKAFVTCHHGTALNVTILGEKARKSVGFSIVPLNIKQTVAVVRNLLKISYLSSQKF